MYSQFNLLERLKVLNLAHNLIKSIEQKSFEKISQLCELILEGNQIYLIEENVFYGLRGLQWVLDFVNSQGHLNFSSQNRKFTE